MLPELTLIKRPKPVKAAIEAAHRAADQRHARLALETIHSSRLACARVPEPLTKMVTAMVARMELTSIFQQVPAPSVHQTVRNAIHQQHVSNALARSLFSEMAAVLVLARLTTLESVFPAPAGLISM